MKYSIVIVVLSLSLLVASFGCGGSNSGIKILSQDMTVHEFPGNLSQSMAVVYGRAQNITKATIDYATISVNFYDKDKTVIAMGSAIKQNLQPGEAWDFSIQTVGPDAWKIVSYEIAVATK